MMCICQFLLVTMHLWLWFENSVRTEPPWHSHKSCKTLACSCLPKTTEVVNRLNSQIRWLPIYIDTIVGVCEGENQESLIFWSLWSQHLCGTDHSSWSHQVLKIAKSVKISVVNRLVCDVHRDNKFIRTEILDVKYFLNYLNPEKVCKVASFTLSGRPHMVNNLRF